MSEMEANSKDNTKLLKSIKKLHYKKKTTTTENIDIKIRKNTSAEYTKIKEQYQKAVL